MAYRKPKKGTLVCLLAIAFAFMPGKTKPPVR